LNLTERFFTSPAYGAPLWAVTEYAQAVVPRSP
jgi:hypothetical protein